MYATLQEIRDSSVDTIAGGCTNNPLFTRLVNEATQRIMRRGDWVGLVVPIQVCTIGGCVVWPRYVGQVRKINVCNRPAQMRNNWYSFLQYDGPMDNYGLGNRSTTNWMGNQTWGSWMGNEVRAVGGVTTPVFQDIMGDGRYLRFYPELQIDVGKTVTVFGVDNGNQTLRHQLSDGTWEDGVVVTLGSPFGSTSTFIRRIDRLIFDDHEGNIRAYAYNATSTMLEDVGTYEAHDNNPSFTRYTLSTNATGTCNTGGCDCIKSVIALVKLRFIPARFDTDLVLIDNISALKLMIQCIKYEEAGDRTSARAAELDSIRELNLALTDSYPVEQTPIGNGVFSGTGIGSQRMF